MKVVTWNVNSITVRLPRLKALLARHQPDVVCLQETKTLDQSFPFDALSECGYHAEAFGQRAYNGVALISRTPLTRVVRGFAEDPTPEDARVISADVAGIRVVSAYVINGQAPTSDKYRLKLQWLDALRGWLRDLHRPSDPLIVAGDFNIAPEDRDVYDPKFWQGRLLCTDEERRRYRAFVDWGLADLKRAHDPEGKAYSWWDYRYGAFRRDQGLRIDLILGTSAIASSLQRMEVDRAEREPNSGEGKPSDHAPVIASFEWDDR